MTEQNDDRDNPTLTRSPGPPSPRRQVDALLEGENPGARVRSLPVVHLNRLLSELGLHDAGDLLELASPEQVRDVLDLQIWQGDRVDLDELLDWAHGLATLSVPARRRHLRQLDIELIGLLLRSRSVIYLVAEDTELPPDEPEGLLYRTPDGWFVLDVTGDTERAHQLFAVIEALYGDDPDDMRRLLLNLRWELPSDLEEWSRRWRSARLEDLGFEDPIEALAVYAYLDPSSVRADERTTDRPLVNDPEPVGRASLLPLRGPAESFWAAAVAGLPVDEADRLRVALMALANRTMVADRIAPTDHDLGQQSLQQLHWRLSLGLECLCAGREKRAPAVLAGVALSRIARVGHSVLLDLRHALLSVTRHQRLGRKRGAVDLIDAPLGAQLAGILAPRPQFYDGADRALRPFHDRRDLERARRWIEEARAASLLVPVTRWPDPLHDSLTLGDLFRTELLNRVLGRQGPVDAPALARFLLDHFLEGRPGPAVLDSAHELADRRCAGPLRQAAGRLAASWLGRMADALGTLRPDDLDLRFVDGLHLAAPLA